ncbi:CPBP family intramembrane glutamic endopeptidase [Hyphobacterium marinum]|uniref:CPBP family intramembrane glutamic endopeptidase n=1 Tax=Hyphobacterium marinum TaxID=3116574 RepID=A0ABU7LV03_9PROT|nr:CPBP family intramembrane glutamic endopeptidase [Hyphobacterium sp. Y6023]MEE2565387.1 CPBP family intramembrane glutamic endopeptidase [Hyphobacterium sp. Y6023]
MSSQTPSPGRTRAGLELFVFVGFAIGSKLIADQIIWKFAGPITLILTLVLLTIYMYARGERWSGMGLRALPGWKAKLLVLPQTLLAIVGILGVGVGVGFAGDAAGFWSMAEEPAGVTDRFGGIEGNLSVYLTWMLVIWTSAAFGEEMFFRGFLITRFGAVFRSLPINPVLAVIAAALIFGYGHFYYQGLRGLVVVTSIGIVLGTLFVLYKRNLWPLILAHGLVDTLGMTARYLDLDV